MILISKPTVNGGQKNNWVFGKGNSYLRWERGESPLQPCMPSDCTSFFPVAKLYWLTVSSFPLRCDWSQLRGPWAVLSHGVSCMLLICLDCRLPDEQPRVFSFPRKCWDQALVFLIAVLTEVLVSTWGRGEKSGRETEKCCFRSTLLALSKYVKAWKPLVENIE